MKELGKWQLISFLSRGMAMALGLVQSFVIIRILTVSEWGLIQLGVSIGGALGIYQHLGLASASTREISSAKDDTEIFKIFITSILIRYFVTLPVALGLFIFSRKIAVDFYNNETLILPLKIYAITILFQGFQGLLNSVIAGTKRFKHLFTYQVAIAAVSVVLYIPLVYLYKINGFFYALFSFNVISTIVLSIIAFGPLKGVIRFPDKSDLFRLFKEIFSISIAIYAVKIIYTNWEKMGNNVIGLFNSSDVVAIYAFALLYAKKLMNISDSVTDVNLPVLSEKFVNNKEEFKDLFKRNFDKVYTLIVISAFVATFWAPEIISILVGSQKYAQSYVLIPPVILAFIIYSIINIVKSSVFIPAKLTKEMITSFVLLVVGTGGFFYFGYQQLGVLYSMSWGMAIGSLLSYIYATITIKRKLGLEFFTKKHWLVLVQIFIFIFSVSYISVWFIKLPIFIVYGTIFLWFLSLTGLLTKKEVLSAKSKLFSVMRDYVKK